MSTTRYLSKDCVYRTPLGVDVKICWDAANGDLDRIDRALLALGFDQLRCIGFKDGRRYTEARETPDGIQFLFQTFTPTPPSPEEAIA